MSQQKKQLFLDAALWNYRWFDDLPMEFQMTYLILWAESDNVGIWKPHYRKLEYKLKQKIDPGLFLQQVNSLSNRIEVLPNGDWWILDYLPLQVKTLTPTNRPHVSYIDILHSHGLLLRYAKENPDNVKFEVVEEIIEWEKIEDHDKKKKARSDYKYLDKKGLLRPLKETCEMLDKGLEGSKEKEQEKDQVQDKDVATKSLKAIQSKKEDMSDFTVDLNSPEIFGSPSLVKKAPF